MNKIISIGCLFLFLSLTATKAQESQNFTTIKSNHKMKVEIWSDIVCPFCYIGKRHFEAD